jgi:hypothetical protein
MRAIEDFGKPADARQTARLIVVVRIPGGAALGAWPRLRSAASCAAVTIFGVSYWTRYYSLTKYPFTVPAGGKEQLSANGCHCRVDDNVGKTSRLTPLALVQIPKPPVSMLKLSKIHFLINPSFTK